VANQRCSPGVAWQEGQRLLRARVQRLLGQQALPWSVRLCCAGSERFGSLCRGRTGAAGLDESGCQPFGEDDADVPRTGARGRAASPRIVSMVAGGRATEMYEARDVEISRREAWRWWIRDARSVSADFEQLIGSGRAGGSSAPPADVGMGGK